MLIHYKGITEWFQERETPTQIAIEDKIKSSLPYKGLRRAWYKLSNFQYKEEGPFMLWLLYDLTAQRAITVLDYETPPCNVIIHDQAERALRDFQKQFPKERKHTN